MQRIKSPTTDQHTLVFTYSTNRIKAICRWELGFLSSVARISPFNFSCTFIGHVPSRRWRNVWQSSLDIWQLKLAPGPAASSDSANAFGWSCAYVYSIFFLTFGKLREARSRLYRSRFLQVNGTKYSFESSWRDLLDLLAFAPLSIQNFVKLFHIFTVLFPKNHGLFPLSCLDFTNFDENYPKFQHYFFYEKEQTPLDSQISWDCKTEIVEFFRKWFTKSWK